MVWLQWLCLVWEQRVRVRCMRIISFNTSVKFLDILINVMVMDPNCWALGFDSCQGQIIVSRTTSFVLLSENQLVIICQITSTAFNSPLLDTSLTFGFNTSSYPIFYNSVQKLFDKGKKLRVASPLQDSVGELTSDGIALNLICFIALYFFIKVSWLFTRPIDFRHRPVVSTTTAIFFFNFSVMASWLFKLKVCICN